MSNIATVQAIYGSFGQGDVPGILSKLAENVEWDADSRGHTPFDQPRRGRDAVVGFFEALGAADFTKFEPTAFLESGNIVVALLDVDITVKATGKKVSQLDEVHIFRFNGAGQVASFRHRLDTHEQLLALKG